MCGILGTIGNFSIHRFQKSLGSLSHRGPDGYGIWEDSDNYVTLGHRRLAIVELTDLGKQPMTDGELTITYNGEIYNYKEIRRELESLGHRFHSNSDTEVILKAFKHWRHKCLDQFNGMWAFAIWDNINKTLFLARDRFGVKPLFYAFTKIGFAFASEMKALAPLLDDICISNDFTWCKENIYGYETTTKSLIDGIKRFPAAHFAYYHLHDVELKPAVFWNTLDHIIPVETDYKAQVEKFRELFFDACAIRMRSDVKIGTALSGGLDSSAVAAAMNYLGGEKRTQKHDFQADWQNAFVATFKDTVLDEKEYAEAVVESLGLKGYYYEIDAAKGMDSLNEYLWTFEELFLTSPIPMVEIYKKIKANGVSVSLDGHGADELLSGYGTMIFNAVKDDPFNWASCKEIASIYKNMRGIDKSDLEVLIDGFAGRKNMLKFYISKFFNSTINQDPLIKQLGHFNSVLYKEFHSFILPTLLRNYDRYSMTSGVEVRMPFLDYKLVTYCFSLPWQSKIRGGFNKAILRDSMSPYLPQKIIKRKSKIGFGTPFTNWFQGAWKEYILDTTNSISFQNSKFINTEEVKISIKEFYKKEHPSFEDGHKVWEHLMPYFWEISFFNRLLL